MNEAKEHGRKTRSYVNFKCPNLSSQRPQTMLAPYEPSDSIPADSFTPPNEADFLGRMYFSLQQAPQG